MIPGIEMGEVEFHDILQDTAHPPSVTKACVSNSHVHRYRHVVVSVVALDAKNERVSAQVWMVGRRNISLTETSAGHFSWTSASMTCSLTQ